MFNLIKKLFGAKESIGTEALANKSTDNTISPDENVDEKIDSTPDEIQDQSLSKVELIVADTVAPVVIPDASVVEPLLNPMNYQRPDPADFKDLYETFKNIAGKNSFEKIPILWASKITEKFQDITELKNIIVAGAQSTGKTNFINQLILSVLFGKHPLTIKLILADSKGLEFGQYEKIVNNFLAILAGEKDIIAREFSSVVARLNSLCIEMDNRYDLLVRSKARNIEEYNKKFRDGLLPLNAGHQYLSALLLVIDDFSNYSYEGSAEIFQPYIRILTQGYKAGIYSIIAVSQTGTKALPPDVLSLIGSRVVFRLNSREEYWKFFETTRIEIPQHAGAFLYKENNLIQAAETKLFYEGCIEEVITAVAKQHMFKFPFQLPDFLTDSLPGKEFDLSDRDALFDDAAKMVVLSQSGSTSLLQRRLKLGYNRAGRLMNQLEAAGIVGPDRGSKVRAVLIKTEKELLQQLAMLG